MFKRYICIILALAVLISGCSTSAKPAEQQDLLTSDWETIVSTAEGTTVNFYMWGGDERINKWVDTYVSSNMKEKYNISVNRVPMDAAEFINKLLGERQVNRENGSIDLLWINGENFKTAREADMLWGPFAEKLPNFNKYVEKEAPDVAFDFGYPVNGYEVPYGKAQFVFTYDSAKVANPPKSAEELLQWVKDNPGKFTYPQAPDFTGSVFIRQVMYEVAAGYESFPEEIDEQRLEGQLEPLWEYLNELKPYLWRKGETYPPDLAVLDQLYADGEILMTMCYHPTRTAGLVEQGLFPKTSQTMVWEKGTIGNTHFLAIPFNASNKAGAMVVADFLESPEAQISKYDPLKWGDLLGIDINKMEKEYQDQVADIPLGEASLPASVLAAHRVPEIPAGYIPWIEEAWYKEVARGVGN
ncbi:MAG: ABC transporter substrate-binding protein [Gracilibacter sp. BRH_c7a]|nr:MAG: ABC transporter substrate-binding protein [Gracilibacter sp. BRH_c7a]